MHSWAHTGRRGIGGLPSLILLTLATSVVVVANTDAIEKCTEHFSMSQACKNEILRTANTQLLDYVHCALEGTGLCKRNESNMDCEFNPLQNTWWHAPEKCTSVEKAKKCKMPATLTNCEKDFTRILGMFQCQVSYSMILFIVLLSLSFVFAVATCGIHICYGKEGLPEDGEATCGQRIGNLNRRGYNLVWRIWKMKLRKPKALVTEQLAPLALSIFLIVICNMESIDDFKASGEGYLQITFNFGKLVHSPNTTLILQNLVSLMALFFVLAYAKFVSSLTGDLVRDKEARVTELLKIMGTGTAALQASWFLSMMIIGAPLAILMGLTLDHVFLNEDASALMHFFYAYYINIMAFSQACTPFFSQSKTASWISVLIWLLFHVLSYISVDVSISEQFAMGFFVPQAAFTIGVQRLAREALVPADACGVASDLLLLRDCLWLMLSNSLFCVLWSWYFEKVLPQTWGSPLPWHFLFHSNYWCPKEQPPTLEKLRTQMTLKRTYTHVEGGKAGLTADNGVVIDKLYKEFALDRKHKKVAVNKLSLSLQRGEVTSLLGHNGAGKSTTINMLIGMLKPTSGKVSVFGVDLVEHLSLVRKKIGVCLQHDVLFDCLTVREHMLFFATAKGVPPIELEKTVDTMITDVGLAEKTNEAVGGLSGGMKRKLSLAIALVGGSEVVLLDEPTSGMDPHSRRATWNVIRRHRANRVIVLTTHFMDEADILGDKIAIIADGQLRCFGTSLFLKTKYGSGYSLSIVKDTTGNEHQTDNIMSVIKSHIPEAQIQTDIGTELIVQLPSTGSETFPGLLGQLEAKEDELEIVEMGMSVSTLEDVFLKIAVDTDHFQANRELKVKAAVQATGAGCSRQCFALLRKRWQFGRRDMLGLGLGVGLPLIFLLALFGFPALDFIELGVFSGYQDPDAQQRPEFKSCMAKLDRCSQWSKDKCEWTGSPVDIDDGVCRCSSSPDCGEKNTPCCASSSSNAFYKVDGDCPNDKKTDTTFTEIKLPLCQAKCTGNCTGISYDINTSKCVLRNDTCSRANMQKSAGSNSLFYQKALCPWKTPTQAEDTFECFDRTVCNFKTHPERNSCCRGHGGRAKCPKNKPTMCADENCDKGMDHCCADKNTQDCSQNGGDKPCVVQECKNHLECALDAYCSTDGQCHGDWKKFCCWNKDGIGGKCPGECGSGRCQSHSACPPDAYCSIDGKCYKNWKKFCCRDRDGIDGECPGECDPVNNNVACKNGDKEYPCKVGSRLKRDAYRILYTKEEDADDLCCENFDCAPFSLQNPNRCPCGGDLDHTSVLSSCKCSEPQDCRRALSDITERRSGRSLLEECKDDDKLISEETQQRLSTCADVMTAVGKTLDSFCETDVGDYLPPKKGTLFKDVCKKTCENCEDTDNPGTDDNILKVEWFTPKRTQEYNSMFTHCYNGISSTCQCEIGQSCCVNGCDVESYINHPCQAALCTDANDKELGNKCFTHKCMKKEDFKLQAITNIFLGCLVMGLGLSFLPVSMVVYAVKEQESRQNARLQQYISGAKPLAYWASLLVYDTILSILPWIFASSIICWFVNSSCGVLLDGDQQGYIWLIILVYCIAHIPITYALSFSYTEHSKAQTGLLMFCLLNGPFLSICSYVLRIAQTFPSTSNSLAAITTNYLQYIFLLFPGYNVLDGVKTLATLKLGPAFGYYGFDGLHKGDWAKLSPPSMPPFCMTTTIKEDQPWPVDGSCFADSKEGCCTPDGFHAISINLLYLLTEAILCFGLIFVKEAQRRRESTFRLCGCCEKKVEETALPPEDEDVTEERRRVESGQADNQPLVIKNLRKQYPNGKVAVHNLCLSLDNECFGYLGINGAGKTTTMKIMTGHVTPSDGDAHLGGYSVVSQQHLTRKIVGYCPQFDALLDLLTVREHLYLFADLKGIPTDSVKSEVESFIMRMDLERFADKLTHTLSGGNKRKLSAAIALMGKPKVVFLDEPSTGMDPAARRFMWGVIKEVAASGCCVVLTTHSMEECEALCSRIGILVGGRLQCLGSPQHLKARFGKGYSVEMRLPMLDEDLWDKLTDDLELKIIGKTVKADSVELACEALGNRKWASRITADHASGWVIHSALEAEHEYDAKLFLTWWMEELMFEDLLAKLNKTFKKFEMVERHGRYLVMSLQEKLPLGSVFASLNEAKSEGLVEEYAVAQTTLEEIFNTFASGSASHKGRFARFVRDIVLPLRKKTLFNLDLQGISKKKEGGLLGSVAMSEASEDGASIQMQEIKPEMDPYKKRAKLNEQQAFNSELNPNPLLPTASMSDIGEEKDEETKLMTSMSALEEEKKESHDDPARFSLIANKE